MKHDRDHTISIWLYQSKTFTSIYDRVAGRFAAAFLWSDLSKKFLNHIPDGGTILEVGTGPGLQAIKTIEQRPDLIVIASDFSAQMLSVAKRNLNEKAAKSSRIAHAREQLSFVEANVMDLSQFRGLSFDGIYSFGAIKHFPDPLRGLHQCVSILKPGGRMYFTDFSAEGSFSGTWRIGKNLAIPALLKFIALPIIHAGIKREAPTNDEVQDWSNDLEKIGRCRVEYSEGSSVFTLTFQKSEGMSDGNAA